MKSHLAKVSLALLSVVFVLGCQELGPTAPEAQPPAFGKVNSPTYEVTHSGYVTTAPPTIDGRKGAGKNSQQIVMGGAVAGAIVFSDAFADGLNDSSGSCFPRKDNDPTDPLQFSGAFMPDKKNPSKVNGLYFFTAFGTDGTTEFKYELLLTGTISSGTFPPNPGKEVVVAWSAAEMNVEGSGKGKKGKNVGSACVKDLDVSGSVRIVGKVI